jgi:uncharacterized phage protein (TIGR01671 family)
MEVQKMRKILFRGQTRRYGEKVRISDGSKVPSHWVYGHVMQGNGCYSIIYGSEFENYINESNGKFCVYSDTVGQYTGLKDKYGKRIFEGDIIRAKIEGGNHKGFTWQNMPVDFQQGAFCLNDQNGRVFCVLGAFAPYVSLEVIGNIHDNPELLNAECGNVD